MTLTYSKDTHMNDELVDVIRIELDKMMNADTRLLAKRKIEGILLAISVMNEDEWNIKSVNAFDTEIYFVEDETGKERIVPAFVDKLLK